MPRSRTRRLLALTAATAALAAGGLAGSTGAHLSTSVEASFTLTTAPADQWPTTATPLTTDRLRPHDLPSQARIPGPGPAPTQTTPTAPTTTAPTPDVTSEPATEPATEQTTGGLEGLEVRAEEPPIELGGPESATTDEATP